MSELSSNNPDQHRKFDAEIAQRRGKLFLVPSGDDLDKPEPTADHRLEDEFIIAAEQAIPEARSILDPTGELQARKERKKRAAEEDAARRNAPPPPPLR